MLYLCCALPGSKDDGLFVTRDALKMLYSSVLGMIGLGKSLALAIRVSVTSRSGR